VAEDLVGALARATSCVEAAPVSAAGWLVLALVQEEMELWQDSMESLRRALYLDPDLALGHLQLARVQCRRGDAGVLRSLANFRKLTEKDHTNTQLPEGSGLTVGEARHLAEQLERTWARTGAMR
jgi:cytochrome c-type biogenesis protein CcmH/NrfG